MSQAYATTRRETRTVNGVLLVGFLGLALAVFTALDSPATGYEPSIYTATPPAVWVGVAVAVVAAAVVAVRTGVTALSRRLALVLAGGAGWSVAALPLLRGYYFYGQGDPLSHLGFARSFASGTLDPSGLLHPGIHLATIFVGVGAGFPLRRALLVVVFAFVLAFLVFTPLCVDAITGGGGGRVVGLFAALLLLPLNGVGTHIVAHPSSQAILFLPVAVYLLFRYLRSPTGGFLSVGPFGALLALTTASFLLVHPQETMSLALVLGTVAVVQLAVRRYWPDNAIAEHNTVYGQTAFLLGLWLLWAPRSPRVQSRLEAAATIFSSGNTAAAETAASQSVALSAVGGSLSELFLKLFLGSLVFSLLAGPTMVGSVLGWFDDVFPDRNALNKYLAAAFVPLLAGTGFVFVGPFGDHYMRFVGFLMVVVTLVSAAALVRLLPSAVGGFGSSAVRAGTVALLLLLLPVATMGLHPSPWMYQDTEQVTQQELRGYEAAFEHNPGDVPISGIRGSGERYAAAIYGPNSTVERTLPGEPIPFQVFGNNVTDYYDDARYVPVRAGDVHREVTTYNGLRYGEEGFRQLEQTPGLNRVQSTDGFRLYMLPDQ